MHSNKARKNSKGQLEISFGWLFAIIAGAFIIFLAIYFSSKIISNQQEQISAEVGKQIGILLSPLETSFESSQSTSITIPSETRIHNICEDVSGFGGQVINLDQKSLGEWRKTDVFVRFENKYIFSENEIEGKKFYLFSKPFEMPFKIADIVYMTSADKIYCFVDAPREIETEINNLNQDNLITNCSESDIEGIEVCFSGNCDINVNIDDGIVDKEDEELFFSENRALMYAAIFSKREVYECQIGRLMSRLEKLSELYQEKEIAQPEACEGNMIGSLSELGNLASLLSSSEELILVEKKANDVQIQNNAGRCMLW